MKTAQGSPSQAVLDSLYLSFLTQDDSAQEEQSTAISCHSIAHTN